MSENTPYATIGELRAQLNKRGNEADETLQLLLNVAAESINAFCNREDGFVASSTATARDFVGNGRPYIIIDECVEVTQVAVKDSPSNDSYDVWTSDDWIAFAGDYKYPRYNKTPYNGLMVSAVGNETHFTSGRYRGLQGFEPSFKSFAAVPTVQVTAKWGYSATVPLRVKEATIVQAAQWYKRGEGGFSKLTGTDTTGGTLNYTRRGQSSGTFTLDPIVQMLLVSGRLIREAQVY